ncbi:MAG: sulfatase-like hydrolase/transferase [Cytophagales bacterium]|nr:sulfatase-like hydrolase/transferase [Cytophaga sp.]
MEVYAAALSYADYNIGRVIDAVRETGQLDNAIIIYIMGDNGASAEGTVQGTANEVGTTANGFTEDIPFLMSQYDKLGSMYNTTIIPMDGHLPWMHRSNGRSRPHLISAEHEMQWL